MPPTVERRTIELAGLAVPLVEVTGSADGPLLTVISGVHGCEYASMEGVRRWIRGLGARELRGRVRAVPVLNMTAFAARTPFVVPEDGKNLNRCFPGDPAGTLADRLAYDTFTQLISGSDALIDAHCGDMVEALQPFTLYEAGPAEDRARELATAYGLPYVIRQVARSRPCGRRDHERRGGASGHPGYYGRGRRLRAGRGARGADARSRAGRRAGAARHGRAAARRAQGQPRAT